MKVLKGALAMAGLIACTSMSVHAAAVDTWTLSGAGVDGTGTVTLGATQSAGYGTGNVATAASGTLDIEINGTFSDLTITGVAPVNAEGGFSSNNNVVYTGSVATAAGANVDGDGLGLTLSNGEVLTIFNFFGQSTEDADLYTSAGPQNAYGTLSFAVTPVPLPPSGILIIPGLLGLGLFVRRTARKAPAFLPMAA